MNRPCSRGACALALTLLAGACAGMEPDLQRLVEATNPQEGVQAWHGGPPVEVGETGPARFTRVLHEGFRPDRAFELVGFIDRFYRAPANQGFDEVLARLEKELREAGFGGPDKRLEVAFLKAADVDKAWTPVAGRLVLTVEGEEPRTLHAFDKPEDVDRVMLPVNTPSFELECEVALSLSDLRQGMVLVTDVKAEQVIARARNGGASAIVSASLYPFNEDKTGAKRHLDAVQFMTLPPGSDFPVVQISPRSKEAIEEAVERGRSRGSKVRLKLSSKVVTERRPLRTLMAVIHGAQRSEEAVAMVSHVQEPGACDNATGVAGLLEGARSLAEALKERKLPWPDRSLVFLWGDEFRQSESWLESTTMKPIVGISSDMTGQSEETGAKALLERNYDPGALRPLEPDWHTPWGAGQVDPAQITPNGLAIIARCAMADVSMLEEGGWRTDEHPWEGGSDHDIFIQRGIPAVLFWHFTDFAYHTSLDRMQYVDPTEMRRTGVALLSTALAVACAQPGDMERYLASLDREQEVRMTSADKFGDSNMASRWDEWCLGTREWFRNLCLGIHEKIPQPAKAGK